MVDIRTFTEIVLSVTKGYSRRCFVSTIQHKGKVRWKSQVLRYIQTYPQSYSLNLLTSIPFYQKHHHLQLNNYNARNIITVLNYFWFVTMLKKILNSFYFKLVLVFFCAFAVISLLVHFAPVGYEYRNLYSSLNVAVSVTFWVWLFVKFKYVVSFIKRQAMKLQSKTKRIRDLLEFIEDDVKNKKNK